MSHDIIESASQKFTALLQDQLARVERMKQTGEPVDYASLDKIIIGICPGDGIGPEICRHARAVLEHVLKEEVANGKVVFKDIEGLTIENRLAQGKAIPDEVLEELKSCHVILKGPTTTPQAGDGRANIESANVAMRRELDLFANVRPVRIPEQGIDWTFFRENTEGAYVLGSKGFDVGPDVSVDFKIITEQGAERIARMAFEYAKKNGKDRVTVVTKSNVVKTTDGRFSRVAFRIAKEYPEVKTDEWYIDKMPISMKIKTFLKLKVVTAFFIAAIVGVSVSLNNLYLSIAGVLIGVLFLVLVKSRVNGVLVDERVISVSGRASYAAYAVSTVFFAFMGLFLLMSSKGTGDLAVELIGTVLCYASMLLMAVYAISYHYLNRKYGGHS